MLGEIVTNFRRTPFVHAVLPQALEPAWYDELHAAYPDPSLIVNGRATKPNTLYQRHAHDVIEDQRIAKVWREFFADVTTAEFWRAIGNLIDVPSGTVGLRYRDKCQIEMDCLFGVNTPVEHYGTVKGPHVDNPREVYALLIYFPEDGDEAGGDLGIYAATKLHPKFYGQRRTDDVQLVDSVPYERNRGFFFQNGPRALHGVLPRKPTPRWRRYVNLEAEFHQPLFEVQ